ncbi:hypothetical protein F9K33_08010 [bacterium]|nr:MAG: hypothetical protein F9K33_08010 [bacterium]
MGIFNPVADALKRQPAVNQTALHNEITQLGKSLRHYDMKEVDDIASPPPPQNREVNPKDLHEVDINEETKDNISRVQGNEEMLRQNAVEKAIIRQNENQANGVPGYEQHLEPADLER